jgi:hypothetical protein
MFPILFFSYGTLSFYNKYGQNPLAKSNIFNSCVAFSAIYIALYFRYAIYQINKP